MLIVSAPTGVRYTNQVGGHACNQPQLEGYLIPLGNPIADMNELENYWIESGEADPDTLARFDRAIAGQSIPEIWFDAETAKRIAFGEAWIPVCFRFEWFENVLEGRAVLTYYNSD